MPLADYCRKRSTHFQLGSASYLLAVLFVLVSVRASFGQNKKQKEKIDFAHQIVPILKKHCVKCHTNGTYKGGLSMDSKATLLKSGAIEVGDSDSSDLIDRITSTDEGFRMPPEGSHLTKKEISLLREWIDSGVEWEPAFTFKKQTWQSPIFPRKPVIPATESNPLDYLVDRYFANKKSQWPDPVDDGTFIRRVSMDLVGLLPSRKELADFKADNSSSKRESLINNLLQRQRDYADHWLTFWNDHLRNDYVGTGYIDGGRKQITNWLYRSLYDNKAYDQFARELIAPSPESEGFIKGIKWRGNVNASQVQELQFAQSISQVFLGENLKCASCHDSFINDWKLTDAYGLAAILSDKPLEMYRCDKPTGKTTSPKFLWPQLGKIDATASRVERLRQTANLVTKKENGRFTRTIVNRIWKRMMGRGLVEPVDIMSNRPWDEDILDYLAVHLQENNYDLKKTISLIANSRIYQSVSQPMKDLPEANYVFRGPIVKRMTAEQFMDSVWQVTGGTPRGKKGPIPSLPQVASESNVPKGQPASLNSFWIWSRPDAHVEAGGAEVEFVADLTLKKRPHVASIVITCDNEYTFFVNGKKIRNDDDWNSVELIEFSRLLNAGKNKIRVIAKNHANTPNPAGLYASLFFNRIPATIEWKVRKGNKLVPTQKVTHQGIWSGVDAALKAKESAAMSKKDLLVGVSRPRVRASHVIADPLMRSLGRPNREQIVTTRDDQLSTLQALDLSNGQTFSEILMQGSNRILQQVKVREEIVEHIYELALSRKPTEGEYKVLNEIVGDKPNPQSVADLVWTVVMLPEFQHVR